MRRACWRNRRQPKVMHRLLEMLGEEMDQDVASLWTLDRADALNCAYVWHKPE